MTSSKPSRNKPGAPPFRLMLPSLCEPQGHFWGYARLTADNAGQRNDAAVGQNEIGSHRSLSISENPGGETGTAENGRQTNESGSKHAIPSFRNQFCMKYEQRPSFRLKPKTLHVRPALIRAFYGKTRDSEPEGTLHPQSGWPQEALLRRALALGRPPWGYLILLFEF
jgi:hypothetical protein